VERAAGGKTVIGVFSEPEDLSFSTYKLVRMSEAEINKKLQWLFFPDQCRHCVEPPCLNPPGAEAIYQDKATGAVLYTKVTKDLDADSIIQSCPYNIPARARRQPGQVRHVHRPGIHGLLPACVKTCPTGP